MAQIQRSEGRRLFGLDRTERELEALMEIAKRQFDGRVTRNMTTCLYQLRLAISSAQREQAPISAPCIVL